MNDQLQYINIRHYYTIHQHLIRMTETICLDGINNTS